MDACSSSDETTLRHLPPLRAAWALRGQQAEVRISGKNARRSLFGTVDLRTGRRVFLVRTRRRLADYHGFLRRRRHGVGACGARWLLLDRHGSHCSPRAACAWPRRSASVSCGCRASIPKLNPVDHLWRALKNDLAANRQCASVDALAAYAQRWVRALTPAQTLRKAGLLSQNCWLRKVRKTICSST